MIFLQPCEYKGKHNYARCGHIDHVKRAREGFEVVKAQAIGELVYSYSNLARGKPDIETLRKAMAYFAEGRR